MKDSLSIHVLFVIDHLDTGGAQEFLCYLCRSMPRDAIGISVCALRDGPYRKRLEILGIQVYSLADHKSLLRIPVIARRLLHLLRREHFDIVHTLLEGSFVLGTPLARFCHIPTVHSVMMVRRQSAKWFFPLKSKYQRWVDLFLTPIPAELHAIGIQAHKIRSVEVTIDLDDMLAVEHHPQEALAPFDLQAAYPLVVSIGRLVLDKGHEYAIRAWPSVLQRWPTARLLIVGDGADLGRLQGLVSQLDLNQAVLFAGFRSDLANIFSRADIYLRTSLKEGVNLTTIQALAAGVPTIGFMTAVPKELIENGRTGLLVPLYDSEGLAQAIQQLSNDDRLRQQLAHAGRAQVRDYYSMLNVVRFYQDVYVALGTNQSLANIPDMSCSTTCNMVLS